ncbi:hypothetical protein FACS1894170_04830 [Planctomycetales bacterium]|nr:hypothetical protein FACS1894170_04830 [Planctomycetales bacterium]
MYIDRNELKKLWKKLLNDEGWKQEKSNFYLESDFALIILALDRSPHTWDTWVECGISIKKLGYHQYEFNPDILIGYYRYPKFNHCHIFFSAECLFPKENTSLIKYLPYNNGVYEKNTVDTFFGSLIRYVFPMLKQCLTKDEFIKQYIETQGFLFGSVDKEIRLWYESVLTR